MYVRRREESGREIIPYASELWRSYILSGAPASAGDLAYGRHIGEPATAVVDPVPSPAD